MKIFDNVEIVDLALLLNKTLVIADVHIGFEEALNKQGLLIPRFQFNEILKRLKNIFLILKSKNADIERIVVNGDLKHEFGTISEQEWRHTLQFLDFISKYCKEIILIKGNHDTILGPIAKKRNVKVLEHFFVDDILITHGDKIPNVIKKAKTIVIAHEHPAVSLREGARAEIVKSFLVGKYKNRDIIVQPSFNLVTEGTDVSKEYIKNPLLKELSNFNVYAVEDKLYKFGKLKCISNYTH